MGRNGRQSVRFLQSVGRFGIDRINPSGESHMTVIMQLATDGDILDTGVHASWNPVAQRYSWAQVSGGGLNIAGGSTIIALAHGNGREIGNARPGTVDITAETFMALVQGNMARGVQPAAVYISTCGPGIAEFAARVRLLAEANAVWRNTRVYGHHDPVAGEVPARTDMGWTQIF
jgi:hypothetical protein